MFRTPGHYFSECHLASFLLGRGGWAVPGTRLSQRKEQLCVRKWNHVVNVYQSSGMLLWTFFFCCVVLFCFCLVVPLCFVGKFTAIVHV